MGDYPYSQTVTTDYKELSEAKLRLAGVGNTNSKVLPVGIL